ncbi:vitamin K epoxide reductase family protein [Cellulomonas soli]|uniref:vitamin K epoxide reductase family protein n=1 Tax=Cellulomonas soli TaxID=931535 RepID=UPI0017D079AA|nr:vitamin K epoxide reductase family protein [Cellulomonas soli]NYI59843.1 putative membrane protein [Cellulomonas soli]
MARTTADDAIDEDGTLDAELDDTELIDPDPDLLQPAPLAWRRRTAIEMVVSGAIGLFASFVLSIEAVTLAGDRNADLGCNLSSVINCGKVGLSWQAELLGFPNAFLGIAAESVVITVAVALIGGVVFPRWFMLSAQAIYSAGLLFAYWLFYEAYTDIGALCPWCLLITVTTTLVWAGLTRINVRDGHLRLGSAGPAMRRFVAAGNDWYITIALVVVFVTFLVVKYGPSIVA